MIFTESCNYDKMDNYRVEMYSFDIINDLKKKSHKKRDTNLHAISGMRIYTTKCLNRE